MSAQAQAILEQARRLSADERANLADALQRSLEESTSDLPPDEVARRWNDEIDRRLASARASPEASQPGAWPTRSTPTRRHGSIAYTELADEIVILAVAHARREPGYWRSRR